MQNVLERPLKAGTVLSKPSPLFARIEDEWIDEEIAKLNALHEKPEIKAEKIEHMPFKPTIGLDDFHKIDLRVGLVLKAEKVAKSKKLLKLEVDLGSEKRTILSGISLHYTPEEMVGKKVVVIANLASATLMGIESQGMILAGSIDSSLELLSVQELPCGAIIS